MSERAGGWEWGSGACFHSKPAMCTIVNAKCAHVPRQVGVACPGADHAHLEHGGLVGNVNTTGRFRKPTPAHLEHGGLVGHADALQVDLGVKALAHRVLELGQELGPARLEKKAIQQRKCLVRAGREIGQELGLAGAQGTAEERVLEWQFACNRMLCGTAEQRPRPTGCP